MLKDIISFFCFEFELTINYVGMLIVWSSGWDFDMTVILRSSSIDIFQRS